MKATRLEKGMNRMPADLWPASVRDCWQARTDRIELLLAGGVAVHHRADWYGLMPAPIRAGVKALLESRTRLSSTLAAFLKVGPRYLWKQVSREQAEQVFAAALATLEAHRVGDGHPAATPFQGCGLANAEAFATERVAIRLGSWQETAAAIRRQGGSKPTLTCVKAVDQAAEELAKANAAEQALQVPYQEACRQLDEAEPAARNDYASLELLARATGDWHAKLFTDEGKLSLARLGQALLALLFLFTGWMLALGRKAKGADQRLARRVPHVGKRLAMYATAATVAGCSAIYGGPRLAHRMDEAVFGAHSHVGTMNTWATPVDIVARCGRTTQHMRIGPFDVPPIYFRGTGPCVVTVEHPADIPGTCVALPGQSPAQYCKISTTIYESH